jgi:septal ring factor EnvC (AmiA/AmiB activator)
MDLKPWIYIVLLGIAAVLYAFMLPKRREETVSSERVVKEVENTLEGYMAEIQNENEQLVELVSQMKKELDAKQQAHQEQVSDLRQRMLAMEQKMTDSQTRIRTAEEKLAQAAEAASLSAGAAAAASEVEPASPVHSIKSRYTELFDLYEQGKSIDMIAKTTGLQRGEVQLIIQLAKQEESV